MQAAWGQCLIRSIPCGMFVMPCRLLCNCDLTNTSQPDMLDAFEASQRMHDTITAITHNTMLKAEPRICTMP